VVRVPVDKVGTGAEKDGASLAYIGRAFYRCAESCGYEVEESKKEKGDEGEHRGETRVKG
jgi:hypothetical protein